MGFCAQVCSEQEVPRERKKVSGYIREGRVRRRVIFAACRAESKRRKKGRCNLGWEEAEDERVETRAFGKYRRVRY